MDLPPYTCDRNDPVLTVYIMRPDGSYFNLALMTACEADWFCEAAGILYEEGPGWTWYEWFPPVDPPVDPEPEDPVQSGN